SPGLGGAKTLPVPKGFDKQLQQALAGWKAKFLGCPKAPPAPKLPLPNAPKVTVPKVPKVTTATATVTTPIATVSTPHTAAPSVSVPTPSAPSVSVPRTLSAASNCTSSSSGGDG